MLMPFFLIGYRITFHLKRRRIKKTLSAASSEDVCLLHNKAFRVYHFTNTSKAKSCRKNAMKTLWLQQVSPGGGGGEGGVVDDDTSCSTTPAEDEILISGVANYTCVNACVLCMCTEFLLTCHLVSISHNIVMFSVGFHTNECKISCNAN